METTGRGWGMWYGSWMGVYGKGCVHGLGYMGNVYVCGMCVFADGGIYGMEDRRIGKIENVYKIKE